MLTDIGIPNWVFRKTHCILIINCRHIMKITLNNTRSRLIWSIWLSMTVLACKKEAPSPPTVPPPTAVSEHLLLGNPSNAVWDTNYSSNYLLESPQFALSYHRERGIPNWVSWHLSPNWLGTADRADDFRPDTRLPVGWYRVKPTDYASTGFDRGHFCPSADRTSSVSDNSATFLMSNMMPQAPNNNRVTWENLESYTRKLVREGNEAYIIAGAFGSGGTGANGGVTYTLASGKITVPAWTWKIVLVLQQGENDLARIAATTRLIAVKMPNSQTVSNHPWAHYRLSVDELEALTGYDFLSSLPVSVQAALESKADNEPI